MFALDLFNNDHERHLAEGAVDQLEQRRIDDLAMKMDDLVARAKTAHTPEAKAALIKAFQKCKDERDGYFKIKDECMGYGGLGETGQQGPRPEDIPAYLRKQQGRAPLTPQQVKAPSPGTISHPDVLKKNLGNPDEIEEGFGPLGSKALMNGNLATFMKARQTRTPVTLDIGGEQFRLTPAMMDAMAKKYGEDKAASDANPTNRDVKLIAVNNYRSFGYPDLMKKFIASIATPETTPPSGEPGEQLPMFEKSQQFQKKKSKNKSELSGSTVRDTKLSRALTRARGAYPTAGSDVEALVRQELDTGERVKQDVASVQDTNTAQDQQLSQLQKVNQQQTAQIAGLEKQLATTAQRTQPTAKPAPQPQAPGATNQSVKTAEPADISITASLPEPTTPHDQKIYDKVQSLEKELKDKIDAMASWNAIAQRDPQSKNELTDLRQEVDRTRKELQRQINKLTKANKEPRMAQQAPQQRQTRALPDPNVIDVDAWEVPGMEVSSEPEIEPAELPAGAANDSKKITQKAAEGVDRPTGIGQMVKDVGQGQALQKDPAYRSQVRRTQQQVAQRQKNIANQQAGYGNDPDEFGDIPDINESDSLSDIDAMRQDLERMNERQFYSAYGISKAAFQQKYRTLLKPAPQQDIPYTLDEDQSLHRGDPIIVTAPNEFEGKTGEIYDFSPSGTFVIVDLYNHGKHSMHLSDVEYNDYADNENNDDWYDDADEFGKPGSEFFPEGFQDFNKVEPYEVCLAGKPVKKFDYYEDARRFHDNWKKKLYREGNKEKADRITLNPIMKEEEQKPADPNEFRPVGNITIVPPKKLKSGETYQDRNKYWQSQGQAPIYKTNEAGSPAQQAAIAIAMKKAGKKPKQADEAYTPSPAKPFRNPPGFNKQGTGVGNKLAQQTRKEWEEKKKKEQGVTEMDKSQRPPSRHGDYPLGAKGTTVKPTTPKKVVKDLTKVLDKAFDTKEVKEDTGSWIVYDPETRQIKKRFKTHTAGKSYAKVHGLEFASSEYYFDRVKEKAVAEVAPPGAKAERMVKHIKKAYSKDGKLTPKEKAIAYATTWKAHNDGKVEETHTDYQKRRQRERDVDAGRPVKPVPKNPQTDYAKKRAKEKRDLELFGEAFTNQSLRQNIPGKSVIEGFTVVYDRATKKVDIMYQGEVLDSFKYTGGPAFGQFRIALENKLRQLQKDGKGPGKTKIAPNRNYDQTFTSGLSHNVDLPLDVQKQMYQQHDQDTKDYGITSVVNPGKWAAIRRAQAAKRDKEAVAEDSSTGSEAVEIAIIKRILVAHTDLIMQFGLDKVTQAIEEVAYNVGDIDEIGTSDVSAYVNQVQQILGVEA